MSQPVSPVIPSAERAILLAKHITAAISSETGVRAIALFGSLAVGREDAWSDVDMLVACEDVESVQWTIAGAIRAVKPVLYFRPFSMAKEPCGRYWFEEESPFQKLDISFDSVEDYEGFQRDGGRFGHDVTLREVYRRDWSCAAMGRNDPACPLEIGEREQEIANDIYRSLCSLKSLFRGGNDTRGLEGVLAAARELGPDAVMAGGRIGELVHKVALIVLSSRYQNRHSMSNQV
jgi:predicted nucleotidyltransferase